MASASTGNEGQGPSFTTAVRKAVAMSGVLDSTIMKNPVAQTVSLAVVAR